MAATVAAADATATIVVIEDEQPGPSTSQEAGAAAAATEATAATEKGEKKKEVNRKGVCVCSGQILCLAPPRGPKPNLSAPTGTRGALRGWGRRVRGSAAEPPGVRSPPPFLFAASRTGAGLGAGGSGAGWRGARSPGAWGLGSPSTTLDPLHLPGTRVTGWGMGLCRKSLRLSLSSRSLPLPPFPVGLCLGNLGPSIPHSR